MVIRDDCLNALKKMEGESIDMAYLDPPFFTQKEQHLKDSDGREYTFSDRWESRESYLRFMRLRLEEIKRVL